MLPRRARALQIAVVGTVQSHNFSGRNRFVTIRVRQGSMRGVFTINVPSTVQFLSHTGAKTKYGWIHKGQIITVTGIYDKKGRHWTAVDRVQIH